MSNPPEEITRSGMLKDWVDSLTDMTSEEMAQTWADIASIPIKECDAKRGCENPVEWWVWFHGCDAESVCDDCLKMWIYEINKALGVQGGVPCTDCGETFYYLGAMMKWRSI